MAYAIGIETSGKSCSVGLFHEGNCVQIRENPREKSHAELLAIITKDILALEAMSELKNYNSYTFKLIADSITSKKVLDFGSGYGVFCEYLQDKNYDVLYINKIS